MSRGPGIWQRQILERLARGKVVILTGPEHTHAEQNAIRRAAYTLEKAGKLRLISHRIHGVARLVAVPVDDELWNQLPTRGVYGLDGKIYRKPIGIILHPDDGEPR
ncbi:hypothetical protein [Agromyces sp. NPDC057865]|uniref:hypothetical protein n=1 Tax=Agromyces sp. NPDC057865 TaxID=3346267 RepID=UPI00367156CE